MMASLQQGYQFFPAGLAALLDIFPNQARTRHSPTLRRANFEEKMSTAMRFWDSGPIISILDLLYDFVRSLRPAWFPHGTLHPHLSQKLDALLRSQRPASLEAIQGDVGAMRTDLVSFGTSTHESLLEAVAGLRTDIQANTAATREVIGAVKQLRTDLQLGTSVNREILDELRQQRADAREQQTASTNVVSNLGELRTDVRMIQEALSKLPSDLRLAFAEVLAERMDTGKSQ
jgi:hypothetical protein